MAQDDATRQQAFELLLRSYQQKIYYHIRHMVINHAVADDLTQDTFIKVWQNLHKFRGDSAVYSWVYRIASNECLAYLRSNKNRNFLSLDIENEDDTVSIVEPVSDEWFDGSAAEHKLQQAIQTLPDKQRLVFNMKYFEDIKYEEMSVILGTSVGALKASYHIAVKKIEAFLLVE